MSFGSFMKAVGVGLWTGSYAGAAAAGASDDFGLGLNVGRADNWMGGLLSQRMLNAWNGNYNWGGCYGNNYGMDYSGCNNYMRMAQSFERMFGGYNNNNYNDHNYGGFGSTAHDYALQRYSRQVEDMWDRQEGNYNGYNDYAGNENYDGGGWWA